MVLYEFHCVPGKEVPHTLTVKVYMYMCVYFLKCFLSHGRVVSDCMSFSIEGIKCMLVLNAGVWIEMTFFFLSVFLRLMNFPG